MKGLASIEILLLIAIAVFILNTAFTIVSFISMKRTSDSIRDFIAHTQGSLNAVLSALLPAIENVRDISSDIREVTADVKQVSHAVAKAEEAVRDRLAALDRSLASTLDENVAGLKAGVAAGVASLVRSAITGKE